MTVDGAEASQKPAPEALKLCQMSSFTETKQRDFFPLFKPPKERIIRFSPERDLFSVVTNTEEEKQDQ